LWVRDAQVAPKIDDMCIEGENVAPILPLYRQQPVVEHLALLVVAAEALQFHPAAKLT
jgi:hypothetical protein